MVFFLPYYVLIKPCPRCGDEHFMHLESFHRPPPCEIGHHWANCPQTDEPIFVHLVDNRVTAK